MRNIKHVYRVLAILLIIFCLPFAKATYADTMRIGASPSIFNFKIKEGESKKLKITIANTSLFPKNEGEAGIKKYTYKVHLNPVGKRMNNKNIKATKEIIDASKWVKFDKNDFILSPGGSNNVGFTVTAPKSCEKGQYMIVLDIIESNPDTDNKSVRVNIATVLEVPLIMSVTDAKGNDGFKEGYKIEQFSVSDRITPQNLKDTLKGLFLPTTKIFKNWADFIDSPLKIQKTGNAPVTEYDISKSKIVPMEDVITSDRKHLNNKKYIYAPKDMNENGTIEKVDLSGKYVSLTSQGETYKLMTPDEQVAENISSQIEALSSKIQGSPTIDYILNSVVLNKNLKQKQNNLYFNYQIKNTGDNTIIPKGQIDIYDTLGRKVYEVPYSSTLITPGQTRRIIAAVNYDKLDISNKQYLVKSSITPTISNKSIYKYNNIKFVHIKIYIIIAALILITLLAFIIVLTIRKVRRYIKVRKIKVLNRTAEAANDLIYKTEEENEIEKEGGEP